jgi:SAM-dependent methyltransferase
MICRICGNKEGNTTYLISYWATDPKEVFTYFECAFCNCLQILSIPPEITRYYPKEFWTAKTRSPIVSWFFHQARVKRTEYALFRKGLVGRLLYGRYPDAMLKATSKLVKSKSVRILDVGCGSGWFLKDLYEIGFNCLLGIDPYITEEYRKGNELRIERKWLHDVEGEWDLLMFHHSLEHMPDQIATMIKANELLHKGGTILVRIPTVSSFAWEHYGINWGHIYAPVHFYLHSLKSMGVLADRSGLRIESIEFDSDGSQFWQSEQNARGIPHLSEGSYEVNPKHSVFTKNQIIEFERRAKALNIERRGDCVVVFLRRRE